MRTLPTLRRKLLPGFALPLVMLGAAAPIWGQETSPMPLDYGTMLRALKPVMTFEVTEQNFNAYLATKPEGLMIPQGFDAVRVTLTDGIFEVSARKEFFFISTRVRVGMAPEVVHGRLHLRVARVHAGPIPLPPDLQAGVSHAIEGFVNELLARNELVLTRVEIGQQVLRVTARVAPPQAPAKPAVEP